MTDLPYRSKRHGWLAPLLTAMLLVLVGAVQHTVHRPQDWSGYHAAARASVLDFEPGQLETIDGRWIARDRPPRGPAYPTLDPIALRRIEFLNFAATADNASAPKSAELVLCLAPRDVTARAYWPTFSEPSRNGRVLSETPAMHAAAGRAISGTEFVVERSDGSVVRCFGFLIVAAGPEPVVGGGRTTGDVFDIFAGQGDDNHYKHRRRGASIVLVWLDPVLSAADDAARNEASVAILDSAAEPIARLANDPVEVERQPSSGSRVLTLASRVLRPTSASERAASRRIDQPRTEGAITRLRPIAKPAEERGLPIR
ncbi:MAG: hypothetical protein AAF561_12545 [Planctomycetota bacterium]